MTTDDGGQRTFWRTNSSDEPDRPARPSKEVGTASASGPGRRTASRWATAVVATVLIALVAGLGLLALQIRQLNETVSYLATRGSDLSGQVNADAARLDDIQQKLDAASGQLAAVGDRVAGVETQAADAAASDLDVAAVSEQGLKSLVTVHCGNSLGSGFAYDVSQAPAGYTTAIITNHHVIEECTYTGGPKARVVHGDRDARTLLFTWDQKNDLALLWVDLDLPALKAAAEPKVGDKVVALGSPFGLSNTVTQGIVSNIYADAIQTDASVDHGNSGGPLLDRHGDVLGIVSMGVGGQNTNFAYRPSQLCLSVLICS